MSVFKRTINTMQCKSQYWYIVYTPNGKHKWASIGRVVELRKSVDLSVNGKHKNVKICERAS